MRKRSSHWKWFESEQKKFSQDRANNTEFQISKEKKNDEFFLNQLFTLNQTLLMSFIGNSLKV